MEDPAEEGGGGGGGACCCRREGATADDWILSLSRLLAVVLALSSASCLRLAHSEGSTLGLLDIAIIQLSLRCGGMVLLVKGEKCGWLTWAHTCNIFSDGTQLLWRAVRSYVQ